MSDSSKNVDLRYSSLLGAVLTAKGFYKIYEELKKRLIDTVGQMQDCDIMPVAATNGFLAVELYLNVIYAHHQYWKKNEKIEGTPINLTTGLCGHNLKELYEALETDWKEGIVKEFPCNITAEKIAEELEKCSNVFEQWQHFCEQDFLEANFDFLSKILQALSSYCDSIEFKIKDEWLQEEPKMGATMYISN